MLEGDVWREMIRFSSHASQKMRFRGILVDEVVLTLRSPDEVYVDLEHDTKVALRKIDDKHIVVVYSTNKDICVVTVYYTRKVDRLIRAKVGRGAWRKIK